MAATATVPFTAISARILFDGYEVGELQNLSVNENNNYQRIKAIGSGIDIKHVPGVHEGEIRAQRVFLEADLFLSLLNPISEKFLPTDVKISRGRLATTSITREQVAQAIVNGSGKVNIYEKVVNIYFDIQIFNSADRLIETYNECSINTRSLAFNINTVLNMEDVSMYYRYKTYGTDPKATEELAPALASATGTA